MEPDGQSLADLSGKRKVRATQGTMVPNRNLSATAEQRDRKLPPRVMRGKGEKVG